METRPANKTPVQVIRVNATDRPRAARRDYVATEEPLEIRLVNGQTVQQVAITMRTPGADFELAAGFLFAEGIIPDRAAIRSIRYCVDSSMSEAQQYNVVNVALRETTSLDLRSLERHFVVSSACGVCGKTSIDAAMARIPPPVAGDVVVLPQVITGLSQTLRDAQRLFDATGGLHAAALFDLDGKLLALREDVGRHNALDKLVGWALLQDKLPLSECILLVSGRASFELVQKAAAAGIPVFCAISAPSSLAVSLARKSGMTLIGFLRDEQFNLYCGETRIQTG
jgi:FdhD protein